MWAALFCAALAAAATNPPASSEPPPAPASTAAPPGPSAAADPSSLPGADPAPRKAAASAEPEVAPKQPGPPARGDEDAAAFMTDADLAPIFRDGPLARGVADLDAGRHAEAARALRGSDRPEARYLAAAALLQAGDHLAALSLLAGLEARLPDLADRVLFRRGQALDAAGRRRDAAAAYGAVPERSILWTEARLQQGRALDAAGDGAGALAALAPLVALGEGSQDRGPAPPEALLLAGRIRARSGGEAGLARRAYLQCWAGYPLSPAANDCLKALRSLPGAHAAPPGPEDVVRRAENLLEQNRNRAAAVELEKIAPKLAAPGKGESLACRARFALGRAYRKERQHTKAIAELTPVVDRCEDPTLRVRALYVLASASSIVSPPDGLRRYRQLAAEYPGHAFADDALFYAADLLVRDGRLDEARAALSEVSERYPQGDFRAEALFRAAWLARRAGDVEAAIAGFARIESGFADDPYERGRATYWHARLLAARARPGDDAEARRLWADLVARSPADWYGLLARARLADHGGEPEWPTALLDARPAAAGFRYRAGPLRGDRHFRAGVLLLRLGQRGAAAEELGAVDRKLVEPRGADSLDPLLLLCELLDRAGDHQRAHRLVRSGGRVALRGAPEPATLRVWRIAYPAAFRRDIERWTRAAHVEPDLLQALMREESALDPRVVSGAGAVGLTQLMLPTAQSVAKRLKLRKPTLQDLMDGELNIRLGAAYLGGLLHEFHGSAPLAVAAYNVGEGAVRRWVRERGQLPLDEFVEEIPVSETRGYVKRVLRSYAAYRLLYGARPATASLLRQDLPRAE